MVRDQRRHSLRERAIIGGQLERADLQTFLDDRHGDRFALLTDGEPNIETVATRELYVRRKSLARQALPAPPAERLRRRRHG